MDSIMEAAMSISQSFGYKTCRIKNTHDYAKKKETHKHHLPTRLFTNSAFAWAERLLITPNQHSGEKEGEEVEVDGGKEDEDETEE
jgi:hypothetical protein